MDVKVDTGGLGSMLRGGTGETIQMAFTGQAHVLVQPPENARTSGSGEQAGRSGGLSDFLG